MDASPTRCPFVEEDSLQTKTKIVLVLLLLFGVEACSTVPQPTHVKPGHDRDTHERLHGVLWMQTSAEYQTLTRVAFSQAITAFEEALRDPNGKAALEQTDSSSSLPPAIVVDVDETILDNSMFQGRLVTDRSAYKEAVWQQWVQERKAEAVPGALEFLNHVASKGVTIFYVTNRDASHEADTRANLRALNLPLRTDIDVVLSKNENGWSSSDKGSRRSHICKDFRILILVGDDLGDFVSGAKDEPQARIKLANAHKNMWGKRWILIPNPLYGSWEYALFKHDFSKPDKEVLKMKLEHVRGF